MLMLFIPSFHSMLWHLWPIICLENLLLEAAPKIHWEDFAQWAFSELWDGVAP